MWEREAMGVSTDVTVFICHRRSDSADHAGRLYELLGDDLGATQVWRAIDVQPDLDDAVAAVVKRIGETDVVVVVIGPAWLAAGTDGRRDIDDPHDPVRMELEAALSADIPIIPVLVADARRPGPEELPASLVALTTMQAFELRDDEFAADVEQLAATLETFSRDRASATSTEPEPLPESAPPAPAPPEVPTPNPPIYVDENVQFTVYRPRTLQPGRWSSLLAFAHLSDRRPDEPDAPDPLEEVRRQAEQVLGDVDAYFDLKQDALAGVPREGEITFLPAAEDVEFNPPSRTFRWLESVHREEFRLRTSAAAGETIRGGLSVFLGVRLLAEIGLQFTVTDEAAPAGSAPVVDDARPYRRIFASYSHKDVRIAEQFEQYAAVFGDRYLRDWIDLRAGENWSERLADMIREADVFQLFWSRNSMGSANVRQEWEYALSLNRPNFVRPTYWEFPMPRDPANGLPPPTLSALHFQRLAVEPVADTAVVAGSVDSPQVSYPPVEIDDEKAAASPSSQPSSPLTAKPVIICDNCGYKNDAAEVFCGSCGQFLAWVGPKVGASAAEPPLPPAAAQRPRPAVDTSRRAPEPGDVICANCQEPNDPTRRFCRRCGSSLATTAPSMNDRTTGPAPSRRSRSRPAAAISLVALVLVVALTLLMFVSVFSVGAPPRP